MPAGNIQDKQGISTAEAWDRPGEDAQAQHDPGRHDSQDHGKAGCDPGGRNHGAAGKHLVTPRPVHRKMQVVTQQFPAGVTSDPAQVDVMEPGGLAVPLDLVGASSGLFQPVPATMGCKAKSWSLFPSQVTAA